MDFMDNKGLGVIEILLIFIILVGLLLLLKPVLL